jgi:FlaA1/EpsC-like NDP-sugar epimerase
VGPRPGEKLHEELFNPYERPVPTSAARILRADRPALNPQWGEEIFDRIGLLVLEGDAAGLAETVSELALVRLPAAAEAAEAARRAEVEPAGAAETTT